MSEIEELMKIEIKKLEDKLRDNQNEYKKLRRDYDSKRRAYSQWLRPPAIPKKKPKLMPEGRPDKPGENPTVQNP